METSTIELQLWIIIGLFAAVLAGQFFCVFLNKTNKDVKGVFAVLYDTGKFDELISQSAIKLKEEPNNINALYFGAKALHVQGQLEKAKEYYQRLIDAEPTLRQTISNEMELLEQEMTANKAPKPTQ
jgi:tetratricopeptide (TPR) repeat protein